MVQRNSIISGTWEVINSGDFEDFEMHVRSMYASDLAANCCARPLHSLNFDSLWVEC